MKGPLLYDYCFIFNFEASRLYHMWEGQVASGSSCQGIETGCFCVLSIMDSPACQYKYLIFTVFRFQSRQISCLSTLVLYIRDKLLVLALYPPFISPFIRKGPFYDEYRRYQTKHRHNRREPESNMDGFFVRAPYSSLSRWVELSDISQGTLEPFG